MAMDIRVTASVLLAFCATLPVLGKPPELPSESPVEFKVPPQDVQDFYSSVKSLRSADAAAVHRAEPNRREAILFLTGGSCGPYAIREE